MSLVFLCFFVLLPIVNATADWASWGITRTLIKRMMAHSLGLKASAIIAIELLLDVVLAILCLFALIFLMTNAIVLFNMAAVALGWPQIDWTGMLANAAQDPWGEGFFITSMLLTTLVPTALHLGVGTYALAISRLPATTHLCDLIEKGTVEETWLKLGELGRTTTQAHAIARAIMKRRGWLTFSVILVFSFLAAIAVTLANTVPFIGTQMVNLALCSPFWSADHACPWF